MGGNPSGKTSGTHLNTQTPSILYLGVSKNSGTQKWMVYNGKPY